MCAELERAKSLILYRFHGRHVRITGEILLDGVIAR